MGRRVTFPTVHLENADASLKSEEDDEDEFFDALENTQQLHLF